MSRRLDLLCAVLLLLVGTCEAMALFNAGAWGARPTVQDEFAYLFQAKTLLAGRFSFPSPPLPEFFESPHLLVVPRFAAKYLPGHAAVLAPFVAMGVPWLGPSLLLGATAALIFVAARLASLSRAAALCASALLLGAADVFPYFASYLSQSSSTTAAAGAIALGLLVRERPSGGRIAALFGCVAFAGLARPFAGAALAVAAGALLLRLRPGWRRALWALPPLAAGALLAALVCHSVTGSWTTEPWSLYARQYMPFDGPGLGAPRLPLPSRGFPPNLMALYQGFLDSRLKHTFSRLPMETLRRLWTALNLLPGRAAIPFALVGFFSAPLWMASVFALAFFLLQLTFHVGGEIYYLELVPVLALAAAAGGERAARAAMRLRRPLSLAALSALAAVLLWIGGGMARELWTLVRRAPSREWFYGRWEPAFAWLRERHALVFIRYPPGWNGGFYDLTTNDPDLSRADLVRAIDLGPRDAELLPLFPDRPAYVLDVSTRRLERLR